MSQPAGNLDVVYLGISGVLHPSESLYRLLNSRSPWSDGHEKFESVPVLEAALRDWPEARIVVTSTLPARDGLEATLERLGADLAQRVIGYTFEDLTTRAKRQVLNGRTAGGSRLVGYSADDYWRMDKSSIVLAHAAWLQPRSWVAIDDEDILWPVDVRDARLVLTDGCEGLRDRTAKVRLTEVLDANFGTAPPR